MASMSQSIHARTPSSLGDPEDAGVHPSPTNLSSTLDENARHAATISRSDSRIPVYVVPTDEELMIAQHTLALLMNQQSPSQKRERVS